mgnify:FL=1
MTFVDNSGDLDVSIPSSATLTLERDTDRIKRGITPFGVIFNVDDNDAPSKVTMDIPQGQRGATVSIGTSTYSGSGQRQGFAVITLEREKFISE